MIDKHFSIFADNKNMKKIIIISIILAVFTQVSAADYQYQYFNKTHKYVPFSDYIPRIRIHWKTVPHYVEDFYKLYGMKLYYNENSLRKNIYYLQHALNSKFRHPSKTLVKVESKKEYKKYRKLLFMHINLLIMKNILKIATRYDKKRIYFHDITFAEDISKSLEIAKKYYKDAIPYWNQAKKYATAASKIKITTELSNFESERFRIKTKDLDYKRIINNHIKKIDIKQKKLNSFLKNSR